MKTASVRDMRQNFPRILAWVEDGEKVAITMRRKVVAHLVPSAEKPRTKPRTPNFAAVSKQIFGDRCFEADACESEREGYRF
jgi:antitoxin (DNA-binding transcriptional repressor) of toxin-antitoxin stability system